MRTVFPMRSVVAVLVLVLNAGLLFAGDVGPVAFSLSSTHGIHQGDLLGGLDMVAAAVIGIGWLREQVR